MTMTSFTDKMQLAMKATESFSALHTAQTSREAGAETVA